MSFSPARTLNLPKYSLIRVRKMLYGHSLICSSFEGRKDPPPSGVEAMDTDIRFREITPAQERWLKGRNLITNPENLDRTSFDLALISGFFMADGSFMVNFNPDASTPSKYNIRPVLSFTQTNLYAKNPNFLQNIKDSLFENYEEIHAGWNRPDNRHSRIKVASVTHFAKFRKYLILEKIWLIGDKSVIPFVGPRYRDYLILCELEKMRKEKTLFSIEGFVTALRLRYNLHSMNADALLKQAGNRTDFAKALEHYWDLSNYKKSGSESYFTVYERIKPSIDARLAEIDKTFLAHEEMIAEAIKEKTLCVNPWYITGVYDGDGGHSVSIAMRYDYKVAYKGISTVSQSGSALLLLKLIHYYFRHQVNGEWPSKAHDEPILTNNGSDHWQLRYQSNELLRNIIFTHFKEFPLQSIKQEALNTCYDILEKQANGSLNSLTRNLEAVREIYATPTTHGGTKRRIPFKTIVQGVHYTFDPASKKPALDLSRPIDLALEEQEEGLCAPADELEGLPESLD